MTALALHILKRSTGSRRKSKRLGRGNASGKGTTAGRGTKGQGARAGGRNRRALRGIRPVMLQTPKLRGFRSLKTPAYAVNVGQLAAAFASGDKVSPATLVKKGLVPTARQKRVKILGQGAIRKKVHVVDCEISESARSKIESAGGSVTSGKG